MAKNLDPTEANKKLLPGVFNPKVRAEQQNSKEIESDPMEVTAITQQSQADVEMIEEKWRPKKKKGNRKANEQEVEDVREMLKQSLNTVFEG